MERPTHTGRHSGSLQVLLAISAIGAETKCPATWLRSWLQARETGVCIIVNTNFRRRDQLAQIGMPHDLGSWWTKNAFELGRCKQGSKSGLATASSKSEASRSLKRDIRSPSISALGGLEQRWLCARFIYSGISIWFGAQPSLWRARRCARPKHTLTNEPCGLKRARRC
jgi:hypothetical protein